MKTKELTLTCACGKITVCGIDEKLYWNQILSINNKHTEHSTYWYLLYTNLKSRRQRRTVSLRLLMMHKFSVCQLSSNVIQVQECKQDAHVQARNRQCCGENMQNVQNVHAHCSVTGDWWTQVQCLIMMLVFQLVSFPPTWLKFKSTDWKYKLLNRELTLTNNFKVYLSLVSLVYSLPKTSNWYWVYFI